ncbi:hypothetical protein C8Q78DRAFT_978111 [Trametes maxima]|nr:hypothetical protein C8Q78DRAFT_978111 [Trametes maxima]
MSGTDLVDSAQDAGVRPPSSNVSEDQAASLRAAALMTLKSKRRKTTTSQAEPMLPHRSFAAPPTIELDYGQEETAGPSSLASSPVVAPVKPTKSLPVDPAPMEVDDVATREEGEISDSELAPSTPKAKSEPRSPTLAKTSSVVQGQPKQPRGSTPPSIAALPPANIIPQASVPSMTSPLVDEDHVRPGLALTQEQYDTAKDIVLDLLGWGVPPEYLVSCGLSRELVYYVFVELNLRLPSNLDTIGLPALSSSPSPQPISSSANHPRASLSHPSLPPKPQSQEVVSVGANGPHPLSAAATPFIPAGSDSAASVTSPGTNLHDMEQQRRQELLARKAVLASRRPKPKIVPVASSSRTTIRRTHTQDEAVPNGTVPTKLVDDFLQSIEPVATPSASSSGQATPLPGPSRSMYDMDVDDVPGLTTSHAPITEYTPLPRLPPPGLVAKSNSTSPRSPPAPQSAVSTESGRPFHYSSVLSFANSSTSYEDNDDDMDAIPGLFQSRSLPEDSVGNSRRGTKRPVAADFVDMEPAPARIQLKGPPDFFRATIRRKTAGFAGLTQRRCVIDLSDSEDDDSREPRSEGVLSRTDSRGPKAENSQTTIVPTPRTRSPIITPSITPATLHEKEEEIRRMRELIALREQSRKKKLIVSTRSTPTSSSTPTNGTVSVKQEEDDSVGVRSFGSSRSGSSATPDPSTNGRRYDSQEERSVLDTLLPHESYQNGTVSLPNSASTSNPATPIDVSSRTLEHSTTGDKGKSTPHIIVWYDSLFLILISCILVRLSLCLHTVVDPATRLSDFNYLPAFVSLHRQHSSHR